MKYMIILCLMITGCSSGGSSNEPETKQPFIAYESIQDFAISTDIYTLSHAGGLSYIKRRDESGAVLGQSVGGDVAGHQGLSIDAKGYFWSTSYYDGRSAVKFVYADNEALDVKGRYTLFNKYFSSNSPVTVAVTRDYLIAKGWHKRKQQAFVKVWYLDTFKESGDYSEKYLYQWKTDIPPPIQGIASDNERVWLISGGYKLEAKPLYTYSLSGELIKKGSFSKGLDTVVGDMYEPEGLDYHNGLKVGILSGSMGARQFSILGY